MGDKTKLLRAWLWLCAGAVLLFAVVAAPLPQSLLVLEGSELTAAGRASLGVLLFCLLLWVTEPIPFHITGLLGLILVALLKIDTFAEAVRLGFGNDTVVFFLGVLILSAFLTKTGLGKRICLLILSRTGNRTSSILMGFLLVGLLLAMWVTTLAAVAMLMPLAKSMLEEEGLKPGESRFGKALMIACAWGCTLGGIATPAGAGCNPIAIGFISEMTGTEISFLGWMGYGVPCALLLLLPTWLIIRLFFPPELPCLSKSKEELQSAIRASPPMSRGEWATLAVFLLTVALWLLSPALGGLLGIKIPTSLPAILGACLLFFPCLTSVKWPEVEASISWSGILLIATGVTVGMEIYLTGAAEWLAMLLLGGVADLPALARIFALIVIISILKLGLSSNTVTATVIIPIMIVTAQRFDLPVLGVVIPACMTLSLAFILVTSTPTNVIPYSTGYFKISDMARAGSVLTLVNSAVLALAVYGLGRLTGIY